MIINQFKTNRVYLPFVIIVVTFLLWLDGFWYYNEISLPVENQAPLYYFILPFFQKYKFVSVLLGFIFLIVQSFIFNNVVTSKNMVDRHSYMPGFIYAVLMSSTFDMLSFHPVLIANFFLIIVLDKIIDVFSEEKVYLEVFNVGLLVGLASLFYFPAIFFMFLAFIGLFVYFITSLRGVIATLLGFFTPFLFISVYFHITDQLLLRYNEFISLFKPFVVFSLELDPFTSVFMVFFVFVSLIALIRVFFVVIRDRPVRVRKRYNIFFYYLLISIIAILFIPDKHLIHHGMIIIPSAIIISCFFHSNKKKLINEFLFTLLIIFLLGVKLYRFD